MNDIIKSLLNHRSYRDFDNSHRLSDEEIKNITDASCQAPSWMNGQAYSIIVIDDKNLQQMLADIVPGNPQIGTCSAFLLYLMDMKRMEVASQIHNTPFVVSGDMDSLIVTATDAALALQNAVVAAESMGYGTVIVGSVRKVTSKFIDIFNLPEYVYPFCGLCIGKPTIEMKVKPRLPKRSVVFRNNYSAANFEEDLREYDKTMDDFAEARETKLWTVKFADYHAKNSNRETAPQLKKQKFLD